MRAYHETMEDMWSETSDKAIDEFKSIANRLCAVLLSYYKATEISSGELTYKFPDGSIEIEEFDDYEENEISINLKFIINYSNDRRKIIESIIEEISTFYNFSTKKIMQLKHSSKLLQK